MIVVIFLVTLVLLLGAAIVWYWTAQKGDRQGKERFSELTTYGTQLADSIVCINAPTGYQFDSELIVRNPNDPDNKTCMINDTALGLLASASSCSVTPDTPQWTNLLSSINCAADSNCSSVVDMSSGNVVNAGRPSPWGLSSCVIAFQDGVTSSSLQAFESSLKHNAASYVSQGVISGLNQQIATLDRNLASQAMTFSNLYQTSAQTCSNQLVADAIALSNQIVSDSNAWGPQLASYASMTNSLQSSNATCVSDLTTLQAQFASLQAQLAAAESSSQLVALNNQLATDDADLKKVKRDVDPTDWMQSFTVVAITPQNGFAGGSRNDTLWCLTASYHNWHGNVLVQDYAIQYFPSFTVTATLQINGGYFWVFFGSTDDTSSTALSSGVVIIFVQDPGSAPSVVNSPQQGVYFLRQGQSVHFIQGSCQGGAGNLVVNYSQSTTSTWTFSYNSFNYNYSYSYSDGNINDWLSSSGQYWGFGSYVNAAGADNCVSSVTFQ